MILRVTIDADQHVLINLYNAYTETEQVKVLQELRNPAKNLDINQNKRIIFAGDFNILFKSKLKAKGGKVKIIAKSAEIK